MNQTQTQSTWPENALPLAWIEKIFDKFVLMYGKRFTDMWNGIDSRSLRLAWAEDLAAYKAHPEKLTYALECCKTKPFPPTVSEFIGFCQQAPIKTTVAALQAPVDRRLAAFRLKAAVEAVCKPEDDHLRWAKRTDLSEQAKKNIMDLVEGVDCPAGRDPRCKPIFMDHYKAGRIKGDRADNIAHYGNG